MARRYRMLAAAASIVLVVASVGLGIRVVQLDGELNQAKSQATALSAVIGQVANPESVRVPLVAPDGGPKGFVLAEPNDVMVVSTNLPVNRVSDQVYVLWGLRNGVPTALGPFDVSDDVQVSDAVPSAVEDGQFTAYTAYAVTLEPGRQAPVAPTTDIIAMGQVEG